MPIKAEIHIEKENTIMTMFWPGKKASDITKAMMYGK